MKSLEEINKLVVSTPNDQQLGEKVRKYMVDLAFNKNDFVKCIHCGRYQPAISANCKFCGKTIESC